MSNFATICRAHMPFFGHVQAASKEAERESPALRKLKKEIAFKIAKTVSNIEFVVLQRRQLLEQGEKAAL